MANQYTATTVITNTHAQCSKCGELKLHSEFHKAAPHKHRKGLSYYCKVCACAGSRKNHSIRITTDPTYKNQKRSNYIKHKFGITLEEYTTKLKEQQCSCAICGIKLPLSGHITHLDHDHNTGTIRSFLCTNCNRGLGHFQDNKEFLMSAIKYLDSHTVNGPQKEGSCL